jgi:hypothetical protein
MKYRGIGTQPEAVMSEWEKLRLGLPRLTLVRPLPRRSVQESSGHQRWMWLPSVCAKCREPWPCARAGER